MWIIKAICLVPYPHTSHTVNNNDFPNKKVFQDKVASHLEFMTCWLALSENTERIYF